jgi:hypothetical protein
MDLLNLDLKISSCLPNKKQEKVDIMGVHNQFSVIFPVFGSASHIHRHGKTSADSTHPRLNISVVIHLQSI